MKIKSSDLLIVFAIIALFALAGCAQYQKLTGQTAAQVSQTNATAQQQVLTNLYNGVANATAASLPALSGGNAQNGQDVIEAAWIGAGEAAAVTTMGQLIADYGGPLVSGLGNYVNAQIAKLPSSLQPAAKQTAAAAVQNVINASAPAGALPTSAVAAPTP